MTEKPTHTHRIATSTAPGPGTANLPAWPAPAQQLLQAIDTIADTVSLADADGIVLYVNQTLCALSGYDRENLVGQPMTAFWIQPNAVNQRILADLAANRTWRGRIQHKADGRRFFLEDVTISPVADAHGRVTHIIKTGRSAASAQEGAEGPIPPDTTYRSILDLMGDGYVETDLKGNITYCNQSAARIYQRAPEELIGLNFRSYMKPDEAEKIYRIYNELYRMGRYDGIIDYEMVANDGTSIYCETVSNLLRDNQGNPLGFGGAIRDITEKKHLMMRLQESEESYRRILDMAPDSITISRVSDGKYYEVNEAFSQQTGYARHEVIGRTVHDLDIYTDPEDRRRLASALRSQSVVHGMHITFKHRDGSVLHDVVSGRIIRFNGEECFLLVCTVVNPLVEAQKALKESEEKYRMIMNAAPDAMCLSTLEDGRLVEVNDIFCSRSGFTPEEAIGQNGAELGFYTNPGDRDRFLGALREHGRVDDMEILTRYKDGTLSHQLWSGRVVEFGGEQYILMGAKPIDDLKRIQQMLREREESYRTILDTAPYSIVITRRSDVTYVMVNDAFCKRTGYTAEEAIGRTPFDLGIYVDPGDRKRLLAQFERDGQVLGMEMVFRAKSGELLESLISVSPIMHMGEACILTMTMDIREQKRVRRELEKSRASYRMILESAPNGMAVLNAADLAYIMVNSTFCRNTGYTRDEIIGKTAGQLNLFTDLQQRSRIIQLLREKDAVDNLEVQIQAKDGQRRDVLLNINPIRYMGEMCYLHTSVDVTPLKDVQAALQESETRFRAIFETAADAIFVTDVEDGRFLDVNQAACHQLGYPSETLVKMHLKDVVHSQCPYKMPRLSIHGKHTQQIFFESVHIGRDGTHIPVEVSSATVMRSGRPAVLSIARDVTERKEAEAELARYRQHLEEMVQERTSELENAQNELIRREKLSVLGQLTATVSHELRNPLGVIRSSTFFLGRKIRDKDEKIEKHIRRIEDQVTICDGIVADLLEFTRGRRTLPETQDVHPWVTQVVEQLKESEQFDIRTDIAGDLPWIPHDQEKMRRVVINLLSNAIQAVQARLVAMQEPDESYRPMVSLKVARHDAGMLFQVSDNGCGMDDVTRRRAFEPLFTTRAKGTGIGLANVSKIVSEHGGRIEVESEVNKGTTMTVILPNEPNPLVENPE